MLAVSCLKVSFDYKRCDDGPLNFYLFNYLFIWTSAFETAAHVYPTVRSHKYNNGLKYTLEFRVDGIKINGENNSAIL